MSTTTLAATLAVIAAIAIAPSASAAVPSHHPEMGVAHAQQWLDWGNSFIDLSEVYGSQD